MARALRIQFPGALYHVTNRGNERRSIFRDDEDRQQFLTILSESIHTYSVILHSFVLMKNHWHMLAQTPLGNLSEFMRHFNITYTSYFNRRYKRSGHLYQGRYKSFVVEIDTYLSQVSRYIHLNPVRVSTMKTMSAEKQLHYLLDYKWSSLPGFVDPDSEAPYIEYQTVLAEYGGNNSTGKFAYRQQITHDLTAGPAIRENIVGQSVLGSQEFVTWVKKTFLETNKDREQPAIGRIHRYVSKDIIIALVEDETGVSDATQATGTTRQIVMAALYKYAGLNNKEIGALLNLDYSTVSQGRKRLRIKAGKDRRLRATIERIEGALSKIKI